MTATRSAQAAAFAPAAPLRVWCYACVPDADRGGVQAVFGHVSRGLARAGDHVTTAWAHSPTGPGRGDVHMPLATDLRRPLTDTLAIARSLAALARRLRAHRPDIVNVHFPMGQAAYFVLLRPFLGYRLVLSLHGSDLTHQRGPARRVLGPMLRRSDAIVVVSRAMTDVVVERYGVDRARVHLIPNAVDTDFWRPARGRVAAAASAAAAGSGPVRLLGVGRLVDVKGFDLLIDAFAALRRERPRLDATLEIIGEGPARATLEARVAAAGLAGSVSLPGHLEPETLRERLRAATLFVLPSRSEGAPLALLEAMAVGTPVLAADVGGVAEALTALPECLVPPDDVDALAAALARRIDDPAGRARAAERGLDAVSRRDERRTVQAYRALFARLVGTAATPLAGASGARP